MSWLRCFHPAPGSRTRLVCFPHAGGSASFFFPLSRQLHGPVEVYTVQYPGRQDRLAERPRTAIADLADEIARAVRGLTGGPLAFFGHSMGAVVAFEVALRLEADAGRRLDRLFVSGRRAPSRYRDDRVHHHDDAGLVAELRQLRATDPAVLADPELLRMVLPAVRSDYRAIETYRHEPGAAVSCPVTVLLGTDDTLTTLDEARAWAGHTTGSFELRRFPGGHFFLRDCPGDVAGTVREQLVSG
jgi:surfactin synthase thioesterase subunit